MIFAIIKIKNDEKKNDTQQVQIEEKTEEITKELKLGVASFDSINPILSKNKNIQDISKIIFDSLVTISTDYKAELSLAKEWAKQSDTEYLIKLREDVKWSDGEKFTAEKEVVGIPAEEFENVIMTYLPVTKEELKEWAVYDEQSNMFIWERLGCGNYSPTHFGLSLPEVTEVRNNEDGTIVLTIHAVCDSVVCNDVVITHELTMKIQDDGTIQYVGNRILDNGIDNIPRYQYRLGNLQN